MATSAPSAVEMPLGARAQCAAERAAAVEKVIAAMHERLDMPFLLDEMARLVHLSPYYFNRVFREVTGVPPRRFHMALRMAAAKRMLLDTDLSVTEICLEVGYQSLGTFTTHFHELIGVSPRGLRQLAVDPPSLDLGMIAALEQKGVDERPGVVGIVSGPGDARNAAVFVGAFNSACPQGRPAACAVRVGPGRFKLPTTVESCTHVAVAAFSRADDPCACLAPAEEDVLVASAPAPVGGGRCPGIVRELRLRQLESTDPPVLLALPLLLARRLEEQEAVQVA